MLERTSIVLLIDVIVTFVKRLMFELEVTLLVVVVLSVLLVLFKLHDEVDHFVV